jgi:hypothetical protein
MRRSRVVDEYGCELTAEEKKELDEKAREITENILGDKKQNKGADQAAGVTEKKKPGRPKKQPEDLHEQALGQFIAEKNTQKSNEIPDIVRDVITEKIDLLERMIHTYDESIETIKADLTQQIADYESRKKDAGEKIKSLTSFLGGAEHGQS